MPKSELEKRVEIIENKEKIKEGVERAVRIRCMALWSVALAFFTFIGKMSTDNSDVLKAAALAAWEVWRRK